MKKFIAIIFAALAITSCSKDKDIVNDPPEQTKKLTKISYTNGVWSEYFYNPDGTLKQIKKQASQDNYENNFTYSPGKITYLLTANGLKSEVGEFIMVNGKVTAYNWTYFAANGDPINSFNESYEYNGKGQMIKHIYSNSIHNTYAYDAEGNMTEKIFYQNNQALSKTKYTYYDLEDKFPWINEDNDFGYGLFFPARAKKLVKGTEYYNLQTQTMTFKYDYTHTLDANGYAAQTQINQIVPGSGSYSVVSVFE